MLSQQLAGGVDLNENSVSERDYWHVEKQCLAVESMLDSQSDRWRHNYRFKRWANLSDRARRGAPDGTSAEVTVFKTQSSKMATRLLSGAGEQGLLVPN